jgi:hypothetical protein
MDGIRKRRQPPYSRPVIYFPRHTLLHGLELRDVYTLHMANNVAMLKLVSTQHTCCLIDAKEISLLALPIDDRFVHIHRHSFWHCYPTGTKVNRSVCLGK